MLELIYLNNDRYSYSDQLHAALHLRTSNYARDLNTWLETEYLFQGKKELSLPVKNYDYIESSYTMNADSQPNTKKVLLLRLEFIKLITLDSKSPLKKQFVQWLLSIERRVESLELLPRNVILGLLEMAKVCTYLDMQTEYYQTHKSYFIENMGEEREYHAFDQWRNRILQIDRATDVAMKYHISSHLRNLNTKIERIAFLDSLQSIRNSMFDRLKMIFNRVDPLFPGSTEKSIDLANFTRKMFEVAGLKPDIKPRHYKAGDQLDFFRNDETIDFPLINSAIRELIKD